LMILLQQTIDQPKILIYWNFDQKI
jgi:hypothetical protein